MKIAFIDDSSQFLEICKRKVKHYNENNDIHLDAMYFKCPRQFISCASSNTYKFDYALIDLRMPILSGFDVVEKLSKICPDMREIICSADIKEDDELDSFMRKDKISIPELIKRFMGMSRIKNSLEIGFRAKEFKAGIVCG